MSFLFLRALGRVGMGRAGLALAVGSTLLLTAQTRTEAQGLDCDRLRAQIAQAGRGGGGGNYAKAARRQASELAQTQAYAHQLGCDGGFSFFGGANPQCAGLKARIGQMQANIGRLEAGGGGGRGDLVARFNAYCRGGPPQPPHERGFFESLFGGSEEPRAAPLPEVPPDDGLDPDGGGGGGHGGSQAVCVRACDGGFFPLAMSAHHGADSLSEMCTALCPGTEATVFTRNPNAEIKTAMSLDGKSYMDLPNALKFQKNYSSTCSCLPAGKSWADALANAEEILGSQRKGDILVTQEKSDELSRPKLDAKTRAALLQTPGAAKDSPDVAGDPQAASKPEEVTGPDGVKRLVRRVGPQP